MLSQLARKKLITRVRRGLYLVPRRLPLGGQWNPGEMVALLTLMEDCKGNYQISGPNTFHRNGWTEQIPNRVYVYNDQLSGDRQIGPSAFTFIKVAKERLGGTEVLRTPDGLEVVYATKTRSLVDAVRDWSRFATLPSAYAWIAREVASDRGIVARLVEDTIRFGNQGTRRRVGATLERLQVPDPLLRRIVKTLRPSSSFIPMTPNTMRRGKTSRRWGVIYNGENGPPSEDVA